MSISNFLEEALLDLVFNAEAYAGQSTVYVQLHTGDPGEDCDQNVATHTTRAAATFGAASGGAIANDANITFTNLAADEEITHISLWDASTSGNPLWYGALTTPKTVNAGDTFVIAAGDLDITLD